MIELRQIRVLAILAITMASTACHGLLDVSDPTLIRDGDIANAAGANSLRVNAISELFVDVLPVVQDVAMFTDEWTYDVPLATDLTTDGLALMDLRKSEGLENYWGYADPHLAPLTRALWQTSIAIPAVRTYTPDSLKGDYLGQLYGIRGYLILQMAEDICPGFPINDVAENHTVYGGPLTTDSAVAYASSQLDSAVKYAHDSVRFVTLARVVKGRALLDQGKYPEAAAMVAPVLTSSVYQTGQNFRIVMNPYQYCDGCRVTALGDSEGVNGLPFVTANDPRIPLQQVGPRQTDLNDTLYVTSLGQGDNDRLTLASGIEARLIEAEAAVHNNQDWKSILDDLRATVGLPALNDPGTIDGRIDLVYRERAFWLFMTGRRLGDLRRLIKNYGRTPESVFPTGVWRGGTGDSYGTATAIPFNEADQRRYDPFITTGCTTP